MKSETLPTSATRIVDGADATSSLRKTGTQVMAGSENAGIQRGLASDEHRTKRQPVRDRASKAVTWKVALPASEHVALQALRRELGDGAKIKKSLLLRTACQILLDHEREVVASALAKLSAQ
ncbi:hypothetical protein [Duganella levis]|uniref:Ribbon-helix-helix protein, CopG family n=1 Tax=Duganella levis TaxID=2692169 RepID=A0ABW9VT73_9BURK|nr:hypothetical protein [Duganella levis]MYN24830.1 hypothetical protein [Duganella levis]